MSLKISYSHSFYTVAWNRSIIPSSKTLIYTLTLRPISYFSQKNFLTQRDFLPNTHKLNNILENVNNSAILV